METIELKDFACEINRSGDQNIKIEYLISSEGLFPANFEVKYLGHLRNVPLYKMPSTCSTCNGTTGLVVRIKGANAWLCYGMSCLQKHFLAA